MLKDLKEFKDYYVLPHEVWRALIVWYGATGYNTVSTLPRTVRINGVIQKYMYYFSPSLLSPYPPIPPPFPLSPLSLSPPQVIDDDGNLELYPITFKVYKHTTLPANKHTKATPWSSFLELIGYIRGTSDTGTMATPGLIGDSAQPILPRRVLYYTASFDWNTTVQEVC